MIPKGWSDINFGEVTRIAEGQVDPRVEPYLAMMHLGPDNVESGTGKISGSRSCAEIELISGKYAFDEKAVVYSKIRPHLNKVCFPKWSGVCSADMYPVWPLEGHLISEYLFQYMLGPRFYKMAVARSMRTGMPKINRSDLSSLPIILPPLSEQRRIAEILSTWDDAIAATEKLIANARAQKKALMQSLLTAKKRLPGFAGDWKEIRLQEIGRCYNGVTYSPNDVTDEGGLLVLRSSNVQKGRLAFADNVYVNPSAKVSCLTKEGDILICVRNGSRNLIGKSARISTDAIGHAHGAFMSLFRSTEPEFAWHLFQSATYEQQVNLNLGATINSINTSDLHKFKFQLPPKDERDQIAQVLSASDDEIEILENQHTALRQEKSALMQQLLAGKRRVKMTEEELV